MAGDEAEPEGGLSAIGRLRDRRWTGGVVGMIAEADSRASTAAAAERECSAHWLEAHALRQQIEQDIVRGAMYTPIEQYFKRENEPGDEGIAAATAAIDEATSTVNTHVTSVERQGNSLNAAMDVFREVATAANIRVRSEFVSHIQGEGE